MKIKKGFTLVELLAVIAILAILVIIALPNVIDMFNEAKKNSFTTEIKEIYKVAEQQWINDSMLNTGEVVYSRTNSSPCNKSLNLSGRNNLEYYIKINKAGKVVEFYTTDGTYQYSYHGNELSIENIGDVIPVSELNDGDKLVINCENVVDGKPFKVLSQKVPGQLSVGDRINVSHTDENFYIVKSNEEVTVLIAEENLFVGYNFLSNSDVTEGFISTSDSRYGLQSYLTSNGASISYALVPFSSKAYWLDNSNNILPQYGSSNSWPLKGISIYESTRDQENYQISSEYTNNVSSCHSMNCLASDNNYSVAYYVNEYVERLRNLGVPIITGRLLNESEAVEAGCSTMNPNIARCPSTARHLLRGSYWINGLVDKNGPRIINRGQMTSNTYYKFASGVRPVLEINTNNISF